MFLAAVIAQLGLVLNGNGKFQVLTPLPLNLQFQLQFDGSLRRATDPYSPDIIPNSLSTKYCSPIATCSTVLFQDNNNGKKINITGSGSDSDSTSTIKSNNNNTHIIATRGKVITHEGISITSADVEYEGLILGLKLVQEYIESLDTETLQLQSQSQSHSHRNKTENVFSSSSPISRSISVTIRGDCKMIMDQMNHISKPRKQKKYYKQAQEIIRQIQLPPQVTAMQSQAEEDKVGDNSDVSDGSVAGKSISFTFEHVTRDKNEVCDSMCKILVQKVQSEAVEDVLALIQAAEDEYRDLCDMSTAADTSIPLRSDVAATAATAAAAPAISYLLPTSGESGRSKELAMMKLLPSSKKKRVKFKETVFANALNSIGIGNIDPDTIAVMIGQSSRNISSSASIIPLSIRPHLLCQIYLAANRVKDYVAMRLAGEYMQLEAKQWRSYGYHKKNSPLASSLQKYMNIQKRRRDKGGTSKYSDDVVLLLQDMGWKITYHSLVQMDLKREADNYAKVKFGSRSKTRSTHMEHQFEVHTDLSIECIDDEYVQYLSNILPG